MKRDPLDPQGEWTRTPDGSSHGKPSRGPLQSIAVYWESKIKTYGFQEVRNLVLVRMVFPAQALIRWGEAVQCLEDQSRGFQLAMIQPDGAGGSCGYLLCEAQEEPKIRTLLDRSQRCAGEWGIEVIAPVELLFFFGPHFGDRSGIAAATFGALGRKGIPILVTSCSGAAVFLVVPAGKAAASKEALIESFEVP